MKSKYLQMTMHDLYSAVEKGRVGTNMKYASRIDKYNVCHMAQPISWWVGVSHMRSVQS
jgi:hypothetical protein